MPSANLIGIVALGLFWGLSPTLYRLMGDARVPITHIIFITGIGVGLGLAVLQRIRGGRLQLNRATLLYGLGCGILLNVPFATSLYFSRHLPVTVYSLIAATSPLMTFLLGIRRRLGKRIGLAGRRARYRLRLDGDPDHQPEPG